MYGVTEDLHAVRGKEEMRSVQACLTRYLVLPSSLVVLFLPISDYISLHVVVLKNLRLGVQNKWIASLFHSGTSISLRSHYQPYSLLTSEEYAISYLLAYPIHQLD